MVQNLVQLWEILNHRLIINRMGDLQLLFFLLGWPLWLKKHLKPFSTLDISMKFEKSEIDLFREGGRVHPSKKNKRSV